MTDWMVYRCDEHRTTQYVNANPREPRPGETFVPAKLCCDRARLVAVADQHEFCDALRAVSSDAS